MTQSVLHTLRIPDLRTCTQTPKHRHVPPYTHIHTPGPAPPACGSSLQVFFRGEDELDQLVKISKVLGTDDLYAYAEKYGVDLDPKLVQLCGYRPRLPWRKFVNDENSHLVSPDALALLSDLLQYDHQLRPTAAEAMQHSYFAPVRHLHEQQQQQQTVNGKK